MKAWKYPSRPPHLGPEPRPGGDLSFSLKYPSLQGAFPGTLTGATSPQGPLQPVPSGPHLI